MKKSVLKVGLLSILFSLCTSIVIAEEIKNWREIPGCENEKPNFDCIKKALLPLMNGDWPFSTNEIAESLNDFGPYVSKNYQLVTLHRVPRLSTGRRVPQDPYLPEFKYAEEDFSLPGLGEFLFAGGHPYTTVCRENNIWIGDCVNDVELEERFDIALLKVSERKSFLPIADEVTVGEAVYLIHTPLLNWLHVDDKSKYFENVPVVSFGHIQAILGNVALIDNLAFTGSSGGTLVNVKGEVIGVLSFVLRDRETKEYYSGVMLLNFKMKTIINRLNKR